MLKHMLSVSIVSSLTLTGANSSTNTSARNSKTVNRTDIENTVRNQPLHALHELLIQKTQYDITALSNDSTLTEMNPFLFFAYLPKELRMYTLTHNFFNNDNNDAADVIENADSCLHAFCLLGEYQQKPHPYTLLSPKYILTLYLDQINVIAKVEKQQLQAIGAPAAPAAQSWHIIQKKAACTQLTYDELQIIKTIPHTALSKLHGESVAYPDSYKEPLNPIKDLVQHCRTNAETQIITSCITNIIAAITSQVILLTNDGSTITTFHDACWFLPGVLLRPLALKLPVTLHKYPLMFNAIADLLLINSTLYLKKTALTPLLLKSSIFCPLSCIILLTGSYIVRTRSAMYTHPNRYTIDSKNTKSTSITSQKWCTLL